MAEHYVILSYSTGTCLASCSGWAPQSRLATGGNLRCRGHGPDSIDNICSGCIVLVSLSSIGIIRATPSLSASVPAPWEHLRECVQQTCGDQDFCLFLVWATKFDGIFFVLSDPWSPEAPCRLYPSSAMMYFSAQASISAKPLGYLFSD